MELTFKELLRKDYVVIKNCNIRVLRSGTSMKALQDTRIFVDFIASATITNPSEAEYILQQLQISCVKYFHTDHNCLNDLSNISTVTELLRDGGISRVRLEFENAHKIDECKQHLSDIYIAINLEMTPPPCIFDYEKATIPEDKLHQMFSDLIYGTR